MGIDIYSYGKECPCYNCISKIHFNIIIHKLSSIYFIITIHVFVLQIVPSLKIFEPTRLMYLPTRFVCPTELFLDLCWRVEVKKLLVSVLSCLPFSNNIKEAYEIILPSVYLPAAVHLSVRMTSPCYLCVCVSRLIFSFSVRSVSHQEGL
jgi:hypothetical protein